MEVVRPDDPLSAGVLLLQHREDGLGHGPVPGSVVQFDDPSNWTGLIGDRVEAEQIQGALGVVAPVLGHPGQECGELLRSGEHLPRRQPGHTGKAGLEDAVGRGVVK